MSNLKNIDFIPPAGSGAGRATASQQQGVGGVERGIACISAIKIHDSEINAFGERVLIVGGVSFIRNNIKNINGLHQKRMGIRGVITEFSSKARCKMMIAMAKLKTPCEVWQDFTFSDDVMAGKSITEKTEYSSKCLWKMKQWLKRSGIEVNGFWKREWQIRKSGKLKGSYVPHYHTVYSIPGADKEFYESMIRKIGEAWVKITGTKEIDKALDVTLHRKSYRFIESRKQMQIYMSKYMVKGDNFTSEESIGRSWGKIGNPVEDDETVIEMTARDMVFFKRCLRKMFRKKKNKHFQGLLKNQFSQFFIFIEKDTINKIMEYIDLTHKIEGVPF